MPKLGSIIESQQFDHETLEEIFRIAGKMERGMERRSLKEELCGKIMASVFYEPSTRTRFSFEAAMLRLGGRILTTENAKEFSSAAKGESLRDTAQIMSGYADLIVLRHPDEGSARIVSDNALVPVINAGDGPGQHPTQALLDLYTIQKEFDDIHGLKIAMVGDLANGRTVRSLVYFIAKHYSDNDIFFISPDEVRIGDDIKGYLREHKVQFMELNSFDSIIHDLDVIYQTRVQKERFKDDEDAYKRVVAESERLIIDLSVAERMKKTGIIMHPLPRLSEISPEVDNDPRARYFEQAQNGLYVRMALLKMVLVGY